MLALSGKSWSGWKFSHTACDRFGEFRVTRYRSGGVPGTEKDGLNGVGGLVCGRDVVPMNVSMLLCLVPPGDVTCGGGIALFECSFLTAWLGVCGRDRSYDSCGVGVVTLKSMAISSYFRFADSLSCCC